MKKVIAKSKKKTIFPQKVKVKCLDNKFAERNSMGVYIYDGYEVTPDGIFRHRIVSEQTDGKCPKGWHVHHCDFVKLNNAPQNLVQIPKELHELIHSKMKDLKPSKVYIKNTLLPEFFHGRSSKLKVIDENTALSYCYLIKNYLHGLDQNEADGLMEKIFEIINKPPNQSSSLS